MWGAALAAYPVAWLVGFSLLGASSSAATGPLFVAAVVPGVVIGLLTGRWKALLIPAVEFSALFLVGITGSPGCEDCGDGGWLAVLVLGLMFAVAPAALGVGFGVLARRLIAHGGPPPPGAPNRPRNVAAALGLLAVGGLLLGWLGGVGDGSRTASQQAAGSSERCARSRRPVSVVAYGLGEQFNGLALEDSSLLCEPAGPPAFKGDHVVEPPATIPVASRIYGTCQPAGGWDSGGCAPPLEIQSWPLCARGPGGGLRRGWLAGLVISRLTELAALSPALAKRLPTLAGATPELPRQIIAELAHINATDLTGDVDIEIYTRDTTIAVFADTPQLGRDAAAVLAIDAALHGGKAHGRPEPANGGRCHA